MNPPPRILVTGASSGIGRAIAIRLAAEEHALILHGRDKERLEETQSLLAGGMHLSWEYDLKNVEEIENSLGSLLGRGQIALSGIVHCAGIVDARPFRLFRPAEVASLMNVNFAAALEITRVASLKKYCGTALRSVVFISSIAAARSPRGFGPYAASKAALEAMVRSLALEYAPSIRFNFIRPGPIATPGNLQLRQVGSATTVLPPLGEGEPDNIAAAVSFLLSDSCWMTGQGITVDGGQMLL